MRALVEVLLLQRRCWSSPKQGLLAPQVRPNKHFSRDRPTLAFIVVVFNWGWLRY